MAELGLDISSLWPHTPSFSSRATGFFGIFAVFNLLYLICPFGFGLLCGALVLWRQSLWWAVGVHAGLHIANGTFETWFTEVFDFANWVVLGLIYIVLAIVVITLWRRRVSA
jgi:hypothetical protein